MIEMVDVMAGVGGSFVGYHAIRLLGLFCFRMGAAFREWRYQRPSQRALRQADRALGEVYDFRDWSAQRCAEFEVRLQSLEKAEHPTARVAILEEQVGDLIDLALAQTSPNHSLSKGIKGFLAKYDKKKDLPN